MSSTLSWNSGTTLLVASAGLFLFIFAVWGIHSYIRGNNQRTIQSEGASMSYYRPDPRLAHSLYACPKLDITNPRDSTSSLILDDPRYSAPPPAYSRPPSFVSSRPRLRDSSATLSSLRQSIYGDDASIFEGPRNSSALSLVPSRTSSPATSRRQSMQGSIYRDSIPSLAELRLSIYGDSNPIFTNQRNLSASIPLSGAPYLSPACMALRPSSTDLRDRQPSTSLTDLRNSLHSDSSPMCAHPENIGTTLFVPRSRAASPANSAVAQNRYSCPEFMPWERSSSLSRSIIRAPPQDAIISMPPVRSRPKTSNEKVELPPIAPENNHPVRRKTSNIPRQSSLPVSQVHIPLPQPANAQQSLLSWTEADYPSQADPSAEPQWPLFEVLTDAPSDTRLSNSPQWPLVDSAPSLPPQPKTAHEHRVASLAIPESESEPPAPIYAPAVSARRMSRPLEMYSPAKGEVMNLRRAKTMHLTSTASRKAFTGLDQDEFDYLVQYYHPGV